MNTWATAGGLLGGIGLFLLGMGLMTDGLKLAAGPALERILAHSTKTRLRGLASGEGKRREELEVPVHLVECRLSFCNSLANVPHPP